MFEYRIDIVGLGVATECLRVIHLISRQDRQLIHIPFHDLPPHFGIVGAMWRAMDVENCPCVTIDEKRYFMALEV